MSKVFLRSRGLLMFLPNGLVIAYSNRVPGDSTLGTWVQTEQQITYTLYNFVFDSAGTRRQGYLRITAEATFDPRGNYTAAFTVDQIDEKGNLHPGVAPRPAFCYALARIIPTCVLPARSHARKEKTYEHANSTHALPTSVYPRTCLL